VVDAMVHYAKARAGEGVPVKAITRHMLGLFQGMPGARKWRRHLSENAVQANAGPEVLYRALEAMAPYQRAAA
jgi:tRNA-dihydrouridine synthase A